VGLKRKRHRRAFIPAWGNAPGRPSILIKGLKTRSIIGDEMESTKISSNEKNRAVGAPADR
jgi:hypothetical protein